MNSSSAKTFTSRKWAALFLVLLSVPEFAFAQTEKKPTQTAPAKPAPAKTAPAPAKPPATQQPSSTPPQRPGVGQAPTTGPGTAPKTGANTTPKTGPGTAPTTGANTTPKTGPGTAPKTGPATGGTGGSRPRPGVAVPRGAKPTPDGKGGTTYKGADGTEYHAGQDGTVDRVKTASGTEAKFNTRGGGLTTIHTKSGLTVRHAPNGARRIESKRPDGAKVVSDGHGRGYVETTFTRGGRTFASRTYVVNGHTDTRVYARYYYGGAYYYRYVPGYYYGAAFYGWAYNPWVTPVAFAWGWGYGGWYGYYGAYFGPSPFYAGPNFWLTDYVLAENLQAAYAEQVGASAAGGPGITIPGNQAWTDTGKYLNAGDEVTITASGAVSMGAGWTPLPPAGKGPNCGSLGGFPAGQFPCWSLVGRVADGPIFYVGNGTKIQASNSGELLLGVNDNILGDNSGNWFATVVGPNGNGNSSQTAPTSSSPDLGPEVKQLVASEVTDQIAAEKNSDANSNPDDNHVPAALDPKHSVFIVSGTLSEQTDDGQACSLTGGDILTRITHTPDANQNVRVLVTTGKKDDCTTGTQFSMSIQDLQDMYNDFQAKMDEGLQKLADNQGKNGMPAGPAAGRRNNPDGQTSPDPTAAASVQQQEQAANSAEGEVDQATHTTGGN